MQTKPIYGVWCTVAGGLVGFREAWLKDASGKAMPFLTIEAARAMAMDLDKRRNGPFAKAYFTHTARGLPAESLQD